MAVVCTGPAWNSSTPYKANDVVTCEGSAYITRLDNTSIVPPDTSGWPSRLFGLGRRQQRQPHGGQVTFTAKTVTPTLNGSIFTLHLCARGPSAKPAGSVQPVCQDVRLLPSDAFGGY